MQELYIPRKDFIKPKEEIDNCPDCGEPLVVEKSVVMLYGKSDFDEAEFMSNMSGSHFCHNCPVVVFEQEIIAKAIIAGLRIKDEDFIYGVLGLVDLDRIPDEKKHLEIGIEENPIPFIGFLDNKPKKSIPRMLSNRRSRKKVGRNEPCPCGSGKKYKKCCY